jgi:transketolase
MVASAVGAQVQGYVPYAATFAAFFSRAYDFIRMSAISRANLRLCGSHAGTEIGQDGPSQMGLEDLAALRAVHGSTVLYPCCPNQAAALTALMAEVDGIVYLRTTRGAYPVVYDPGTQVRVGGSAVLRQSDADRVALIGAGVTVHHCLDAAEELQREGVHARVIDLYSVKPVDLVTLREAAAATGGRLVVVEDHYPEGGIGGAVLEALALEPQPPRVAVLGVRGLPASGTPEELMDDAGISAPHVVRAALRLVGRGE